MVCSKEGSCARCVKADLKCVYGPSRRRQRAPPSKRQSNKISSERIDDASSNSEAENRSSSTFLICELTHLCLQVRENALMVVNHLAFVRSRTYIGQKRIQKLHLKLTFDLSQWFIKILSIGRYLSVLPWPASQYTDGFASAFDQADGMQASTLLLLSCYTYLLETHDDILSCFVRVVERWGGTQQVQYDDHAVSSYAQIQQIRVSAERMVQMLRRSQGILDELRKAIRSSSTIWDSNTADLSRKTSHSIDVTRSAVLAVQIRECDLDSCIDCLHKFLAIKLLKLAHFASPSAVPLYLSQGQQISSQQNMPESDPKFPTHLTSMESTKSKQTSSIPSPQHTEVSSTNYPQRSTDTRADIGTYSCTYHGCTQRFDTPSKLQKHKYEGHRQVSPTHTRFDSEGDIGSPSTAALAVRNSQAGLHKCERIKSSTGKPCNNIFSRPSNLTRHEDIIHDVRQKVRCQYCTEEKTFSCSDALVQHIHCVHLEMKFSEKTSRRGALVPVLHSATALGSGQA